MLVARKNPKRRTASLRDSELTRERLLHAASREIYRSGFQTASQDAILASTGVTKGAQYYHFKSKAGLGYAVVEKIAQDPKVIKAGIRNIVGWLRSVRPPGNRRRG